MLARSFLNLCFGFCGQFLVEILFRGASATYFSKVFIGWTNILKVYIEAFVIVKKITCALPQSFNDGEFYIILPYTYAVASASFHDCSFGFRGQVGVYKIA